MRHYFVTGATGAIGSTLACMLLSDPGNELSLLIRAASDDDATARLRTLCDFWQMDPANVKRRVKLVRGDAALPAFGLDASQWNALTRTCSHIIHCAALVKMNLPLPQARQSAMSTACNVIDMATASMEHGRFNKVEFLSTVGVAGRRPGVLPEECVKGARSFHNTYEQAKSEAEDLACAAVERGLPLTIHRPSMVVGDSRTGRIVHFQVFYHLVEFLSGRRTFGVFPSLDAASLDVVPVDYVAAAIACSSTMSSYAGRILHLCSGSEHAVGLTVLQETVRTCLLARGERLPRRRFLPRRVFRAALPLLRTTAPASLRKAIGALPILLDYLGGAQTFGCERTRALLEPEGLALPDPASYLPQVIDYYLDRKHS
ncbi:MAG TPA: SDR family oxidoreductase [Ideonella sp.]|uniref:SDR family oxidoreductase n=1 Tax=Ideonella sp. TaxID=1929293 RepID=UPI002E2F0EF0|nr:SDR family oxidoreductase [Ideonella sp.]HEX5682763.1 SDR family oxidoreductase [Ideonella sp.]